jgi:RAP1 GTPase activating protein 1
VVIVFQDGDAVYKPTTVSSRQIHVVLLVKACIIDDERHYRLAVVSRDDVSPFAPVLPEPAVFKKGADFRDFLYKKCMSCLLSLDSQ